KLRRHPRHTLFPYTTLFRSLAASQTKNCKLKFRVLLFPAREKKERVDRDQCQEDFSAVQEVAEDDSIGKEKNLTWGMARDSDERSEEHTSELQSLRHLVCRL